MNASQAMTLMSARELMRHHDRASVADWADVLAGFPLFSTVGRRRLRKLVREATFAEFAAGEIVLARGGADDRLYVVLGGRAKTFGGRAARGIAVGDYFGELSVLSGEPRSATVVATQQLHVMRLPRRSVMRLARRHPALVLTLLRDLSRHFIRMEARTAPVA